MTVSAGIANLNWLRHVLMASIYAGCSVWRACPHEVKVPKRFAPSWLNANTAFAYGCCTSVQIMSINVVIWAAQQLHKRLDSCCTADLCFAVFTSFVTNFKRAMGAFIAKLLGKQWGYVARVDVWPALRRLRSQKAKDPNWSEARKDH